MEKQKEQIKGEILVGTAEGAIREMLSNESITIEELARQTGRTRQNISQSINRNTRGMRFDNFQKLVSALGYEIVLRK